MYKKLFLDSLFLVVVTKPDLLQLLTIFTLLFKIIQIKALFYILLVVKIKNKTKKSSLFYFLELVM